MLARVVLSLASVVVIGGPGLAIQSGTVSLGALTFHDRKPLVTIGAPRLRNTSFDEDSPDGLDSAPRWTEGGDTRASFTEADGRNGKLALSHWGPVPYRVETSQLVSGLPEGRYTASIWAKVSSGHTAAYIALRGCGGPDARTPLPVSPDQWRQVSVSTTVTGGACTFSLVSDGPARTWACFDDAQLVRTGGAMVQPVATVAALLAGMAVAVIAAVIGTVLVTRWAVRAIFRRVRAVRRRAARRRREQEEGCSPDDVAELKQSFHAIAASLMRDEQRQRRLVADIAHELRTPLSTVRSYLEALIDGVLPAEHAVFVSLHDEAMLQQRIIDDLQDLGLAESGALSYHKQWLNVAELLHSCLKSSAVKAADAGVSLSVRGDADIDVYADADRLRQVVGNLVSNALRYTAPGGHITLRGDASRGTVIIEVTDTGSGIASEDLSHVFDRFWRATGARGATSGGSGLGLAIARQIVTDHDGEITVASRLDEGTTFSIRLPMVTGHLAALAQGPSVQDRTSR